MNLNELQKNWDAFGKQDPMWAILSDPAKKGNKWDKKEFFNSGRVEIDSVFQDLESLNVSVKRGKALDFGCGLGRNTQALCRYFDECVGIDIAPSMIQSAQKYSRFKRKCKYYVNDSDNLNAWQDNYFDFIYSRIVLQHIQPEYSKNYLREFVRILAPGGLLLFQLPSELAPIDDFYTLDDSAYKAEITLSKTLSESSIIAQAGSTIALKTKVKNLSDISWPAFDSSSQTCYLNLGNHWLNELGEIIINDDGRKPLIEGLKPQEETEVELTITIPKQTGSYTLELDMVHEGVTWFKDRGSQTLKIPVTVVEKLSQSPKLNLVNVLQSLINPAQLKTNSPQFVPQFEMHCVPKEIALDIIKDAGGKIVDVRPDSSAGRWWLSYLYLVTK